MFLLTSSVASGTILRDEQIGPFYDRVAIWDATDVTLPKLRSYYQRLSPQLRNFRAWTIEVFVDRGDAFRETHGKLVVEVDYDWWLKLYDDFGRSLLPSAKIYGYENNVVMRIRNGIGECTETVLSGDNFLRVHTSGIDFEILEAYYHPLPPGTRSKRGDEAMVSVYVRASRFPTEDQATALSRLIRQRLRQERITVQIRVDSFFIMDHAFPIVYRFNVGGAPPTRDQYRSSLTMYCVGPKMRCSSLAGR